jgi:hypothetical protein
MADVQEPGACQACGRSLPIQHGKGRRRYYCNAGCRDAARRERVRSGRHVKAYLTSTERHENLDSNADSPLEAVAAAREMAAAAEAALQAAVDHARAAGQSWREIGEVLGTTRQAAFQRFGHPVEPGTSVPVQPEMVQRAAGFLSLFTGARWEAVLGEFDDAMRERHDMNRLADGWAHLTGMFGRYQGMGEISPVPAGDSTVVDVRLNFEAGEAMALVHFDRDGKVCALRLHPPSAS